MIRLSRDPPTIREFGNVFEHVYQTILSERHSSVRHAFRQCNLDLDNPFHWADLLRALCDLNFTIEQNVNQTRTPAFIKQLTRHRAYIRAKFPKLKSEDQAKKMKAEFPDEYGYLEIASIRRLFYSRPKRKNNSKRLIIIKK